MTGGQQTPPLRVAGVKGGVGTSTLARILHLWSAERFPVEDHGQFNPRRYTVTQPLHILVTSNAFASTTLVGKALHACQPVMPVLVVMHTHAGDVAGSRSQLLKVEPHVTAMFTVAHRRDWLALPAAPGRRLPAKLPKDLAELFSELPGAWRAMYQEIAQHTPPPQPAVTAPARPLSGPYRSPAVPRAGPPPVPRWPQAASGGPSPALHRGRQQG